MANKRCVSLDIIDNDDFTDLSIQAQALYFHSLVRCDDDGVCDCINKVCKIIGVDKSYIKELVDKKFLLQFDKVYVIKHWWIHNSFRADTYTKSNYCDKVKLYLKANKSYTKNNETETERYNFGQSPLSQIKEKEIKVNKNKLNKTKLNKSNLKETHKDIQVENVYYNIDTTNDMEHDIDNDNDVESYEIPSIWDLNNSSKALKLKILSRQGLVLSKEQQLFLNAFNESYKDIKGESLSNDDENDSNVDIDEGLPF